MSYTMHRASILDWARDYTGPKYHALLCDPPYHLTTPGHAYGYKSNLTRADLGTARPSERGFMNAKWDGGDVAYRPETWAALAEHLHPGAFGMAFAGSRGWHRMAVAIEGLVGVPISDLQSVSDLLQLAIETRKWELVEEAKKFVDGWLRLTGALVEAGLIIHPTIFGWAYGSGFPKATRLDVQLDRRAGAVRQVVGTRKHAPKFDAAGHGYREKDNGYNSRERESFDVTAPATELAADWAGYRYGLQALKPAVEPIIVFQKPYAGRPVDSIAATGAGALWIDGGRVGGGGQLKWAAPRDMGYHGGSDAGKVEATDNPLGRWPANLILSHGPRCDADGCSDDCPVRRLGEQSGESASSGGVTPRTQAFLQGVIRNGDDMRESGNRGGLGDTGTAARYFYQADYALERAEAGVNNYYKCVICGCKDLRHGIMNEKHYTHTEDICSPATSAESSLSQQNGAADSALMPARPDGKTDSAATLESNSILAPSAESNLRSSQETNESTVPQNAHELRVAQIARDARFAENLCGSCATAIARALVATLQGSDPESHLGAASIPERKKRILTRSLALAVESQDNTGTTPTMDDLRRLFGFVALATEKSTEAKGEHGPVIYTPKASRAEREAGLDPRTVALMRLIDDGDEGDEDETFDQVTVDDGRATPIDNPYLRGETKRRNPHPTVKPISLTMYLSRLLLPPERYGPRRLLVPFAGVASEMIGGMLAGWEHIDGIELDEDGTHIPVGEARLRYWEQRRHEFADPSRPVTVKASAKIPKGQLDMFDKEAA